MEAIVNLRQEDIEAILQEIRKLNKEIGLYKEHSNKAYNYNYPVRLTNGHIYLYLEEIQFKDTLPVERFKDIAARFRKID